MVKPKTFHEEKSKKTTMRYDGNDQYTFLNVGVWKCFLFWLTIHLSGVKYKIDRRVQNETANKKDKRKGS
jgi:hypothetical protein